MKRLILAVLVIGVLLLGGCAVPSTTPSTETPPKPVPSETPKAVIVEPLPPKVEMVSSLKVNVDQSYPDKLVLSFEYYDANKQKITFSNLENIVVVEIDGKTTDGRISKVLSSQTIKAPIIYSSEDSVVIPMNLLNLKGVDRDNLKVRVHIKGDKIYVFGEAEFSLR